MIRNLSRGLAVVLVAIGLCASASAQPVKKKWIVEMWNNTGTRSLIEPQIKARGIAFLPTDSVRLEMETRYQMTPEMTMLLTRNFARNLTFMVCRFSCDNCGSSTSDLDSFNEVVLDRMTYEKQLRGSDFHDPLFGKMLYPSLGPQTGPSPGMTLSAIVVFVTGHVRLTGSRMEINPRLSYTDRNFDAKVLGTKVISTGKNQSQLKAAAQQIAVWSLGVLRDETR